MFLWTILVNGVHFDLMLTSETMFTKIVVLLPNFLLN